TDADTITLSGSDVTNWVDKSANGINFVGTAGAYPVYVADGINGLPVLSFNGTNQKLRTAFEDTPIADGDDSYTYAVVWKPTGTALATMYEQNHSTVVTGRRAALLKPNATTYGYNGQSNDAHSIAPYTANKLMVTIMLKKDLASSNIVVYDNGTAYTGTVNNTTANISNDYASVGYKLNANVEYFVGYIAEIIVFDKELSLAEIRIVNKYLKTKWKIPTAVI
ncbi:hypothetical protein KKC59_04350, partial [bacterium]|nr:hypothetical protein [bacterium]